MSLRFAAVVAFDPDAVGQRAYHLIPAPQDQYGDDNQAVAFFEDRGFLGRLFTAENQQEVGMIVKEILRPAHQVDDFIPVISVKLG